MSVTTRRGRRSDGAARPSETEIVHACIERNIPPQDQWKALSAAMKERADNMLTPGMTVGFKVNANAVPAPAMALVIKKLWKRGRKLRCRFMGSPPPAVREAIEHYAHQWEQHADIKFVFGSDPAAEIRIACREGQGSWSYLGTDALAIAKNQPTMNYGWFTSRTPDEEFARTTLHEFGHALGCIHEHNHPKNGIPWNKPVVYAYYKSTQGWSKQDVDDQLFGKYSASQLNSSAYDAKSIMHYPVPRQHTIGGFEVGWNTRLSPRDKTFIAKQY